MLGIRIRIGLIKGKKPEAQNLVLLPILYFSVPECGQIYVESLAWSSALRKKPKMYPLQTRLIEELFEVKNKMKHFCGTVTAV
jgi:hypothetical protein